MSYRYKSIHRNSNRKICIVQLFLLHKDFHPSHPFRTKNELTYFTPRCRNHSPLRMQSWVHAEDRNPIQNPRFNCLPPRLDPACYPGIFFKSKGKMGSTTAITSTNSVHIRLNPSIMMDLEERSTELVSGRKNVLYPSKFPINWEL